MPISKRLLLLTSLINDANKGVFDVGSDHGYLLLELYHKGFKGNLKGVENKIGPFSNLSKNTLNSPIKVSLSDGIDDLTNDYSCLVLAGMGFSNIAKIIDKHKEKLSYIDQIVIDAHNFIPESRKYFINHGFKIEEELILKENNIYYELISFIKGNENYSEEEIVYGPKLLKKRDEVFINKYKEANQKLAELLFKLDKNSKRYKEIQNEIDRNILVISK